jgi:hypothetical protein
MDHRAPRSTVDYCRAGVARSSELCHLATPVDGSSPRWREKGEGRMHGAAHGLSWPGDDEQWWR